MLAVFCLGLWILILKWTVCLKCPLLAKEKKLAVKIWDLVNSAEDSIFFGKLKKEWKGEKYKKDEWPKI